MCYTKESVEMNLNQEMWCLLGSAASSHPLSLECEHQHRRHNIMTPHVFGSPYITQTQIEPYGICKTNSEVHFTFS